ncbi:MAG: hypothetical protein GF411_14415 [Candidatus Lokiarchaeota archaeon]|nr:hypothetical protein [Candidatus Lokiarchaeota archaeon]
MNLRYELDRLNNPSTVIIVGRGHSGTRLITQLLSKNGVFLGNTNDSYDMVPADHMYDAAKEFGLCVEYVPPLQWHIKNMPPTESYMRYLYEYLYPLLGHDGMVGWKLPETIFSLPWIISIFPNAKYLYWSKNPMHIMSRWHISDNLNSWGVQCDCLDPIEMRASSILYQLRMMNSYKPKHYFDVDAEFFVKSHNHAVEWISGFIGKQLSSLNNIDADRAHRPSACNTLVDEFVR